MLNAGAYGMGTMHVEHHLLVSFGVTLSDREAAMAATSHSRLTTGRIKAGYN